MKYPSTLSEDQTLTRVLSSASIGRYGDGELAIMRGGNCVSQVYDPNLASELRGVLNGFLHGPLDSFVVGIPTIASRCPKLTNWMKLVPRFEELLDVNRPKAPVPLYGSAFISRPDSAPWINTPEFFDRIQSLWEGQRVVLVANGRRSLTREFLLKTGAAFVDWIECPYRDAYAAVGRLYRQCMASPLNRVVLCCGPTATVLADRLHGAGKHAVDLGHIGMFWRGYERT